MEALIKTLENQIVKLEKEIEKERSKKRKAVKDDNHTKLNEAVNNEDRLVAARTNLERAIQSLKL